MRIEFSFNNTAIEQGGYALEDIYHTIKEQFAGRNIPCASDGDTLAFEDTGGKNDFSSMWAVIMRLTRSDWFMEFATSCIWRQDNDKWEDVLRQARADRKGVANGQ